MNARGRHRATALSPGSTFILSLAIAATPGCGGELDDDGAIGGDGIEVITSALSAPDDPRFREQWGLRNTGQTVPVADDLPDLTGIAGVDIGVLGAWDVTQGSPSVVVAVIEQLDTDLLHPDLVRNLFVNPGEAGARATNGIDDDHNGYVDDVSGFDFVDRDGANTPNDHATHVAGIIAAESQNGVGISGVAPKVRLLPLRATANTASMVEAITYAKRMGARIASISQGGSSAEGYNNPAVFDAMNANRDMLFVCSAGNRAADPAKGNASYNYPSSFNLPNVVSVANIDGRGELAPGSFYGEINVDLAAPGVGILSTFPGSNYGFDRGTSMAAPHVAGVAALLLSRFPSMTPAEISDRLQSTGMRLGSLDRMVKSGAMLDARAALAGVAPMGLQATSAPGTITLTWNPQPGAIRYQVERDGTMVDAGTATRFVHGNLVVDSPHIYRVRPRIVDGSGSAWGPWSRRWMKKASQESVIEPFFLATPHPYPNDFSQDYEASKRNAKLIRVHFARIDTQPEDFLSYEILDYDQDRLVAYGGHPPDPFWSHWSRGTFRFDFRSDTTGNGFGFTVDKIEYVATIPDVPEAPFLFATGGGSTTIGFGATPGSNDVLVYRSTAANGGYLRLATVAAGVGQYTDATATRNRTFYYRVSCRNDLGESAASPFLKVLAQ